MAGQTDGFLLGHWGWHQKIETTDCGRSTLATDEPETIPQLTTKQLWPYYSSVLHWQNNFKKKKDNCKDTKTELVCCFILMFNVESVEALLHLYIERETA